MSTLYAGSWWAVALRGVAAIVFGLIALFLPGDALLALVLVFSAFALVNGISAIVMALRERTIYPRWWVLFLQGALSVVVGVIAFIWPGITALTLLYVIAFWAITSGVFEIIAAVELRKSIDNEWLLALSGVLSIIFGVLLVLFPGTGALTLVWLIGSYSIVFGVLLVILGFRLRSHHQRQLGNTMPGSTTGTV